MSFIHARGQPMHLDQIDLYRKLFVLGGNPPDEISGLQQINASDINVVQGSNIRLEWILLSDRQTKKRSASTVM